MTSQLNENIISIYFDNPMSFEPSNIKPLNGIVGLYFIFNQTIDIQYPFDKSKLLYIGMSERKTNSIGSRLLGHYDGKSKNLGLSNLSRPKICIHKTNTGVMFYN